MGPLPDIQNVTTIPPPDSAAYQRRKSHSNPQELPPYPTAYHEAFSPVQPSGAPQLLWLLAVQKYLIWASVRYW